MKVLDYYLEKQKNTREHINKGLLPVEQIFYLQELNYRICVLETMRDFCMTAPVSTDIKVLSLHYKTVEAYLKFITSERQFGLKTDENGIKQRETSFKALDNVVNEERRKYSGFKASSPNQYKEMISLTINSILFVWLQYRTNYINL